MSPNLNYKNKRVTIMGLGLQGSGVSVTKFFAKQGAKVIVTDIKTKDRLRESMEKLKKFKNIKYVLGQHRPEDFSKVNLVIKGPAIPDNSKYLEIAQKNKVTIDTEAGVFFELVKNPVIGVTGTRGKSTTTQLIYEMLKKSGKKAVIGGNIQNRPLLDLLQDVKKEAWMVLELSSFQLEGIEPHQKSPHIAVVTNFMSDHLNRYRNLEVYHQSKETIVKYQTNKDFAVLNHDDEKVRQLAANIKSTCWFFSLDKVGGENVVFISDNKIFVRKNKAAREIVDLTKLKLIGRHRIPNVLATVAVGAILGISDEVIKETVENFSGIDHRLEVVREVNGVLYVNDTTATVPEAAQMALKSFKGPITLIAGGADKGLDFSSLAQNIIKKVNELIFLTGTGTDRLIKAIKKEIPDEFKDGYDFTVVNSMEEAVNLAAENSESGHVVLLSPGCSSFGMFENEFERGDKFKEAVNAL